MKRKTSTTPTKIWSFGALPPTTGTERFSDQLFLASRYYNALIEIERKRRDKFRQDRSEAVPALAQLEADYARLNAELEAAVEALPKPAGKKTKKKLTPELLALRAERNAVAVRMKAERQIFLGPLIEKREKLKQARSDLDLTLAPLRAEYAKLDAELKAGIRALPVGYKKKQLTDELLAIRTRRDAVSSRMKSERSAFKQSFAVDDNANIDVKAARAATDLYWGSYLLIEKQIEQARKSKLDPRFRRFEGSGRVGVQLQGGLTVAELESGEDTRLRLVKRSSPAKVKNPKCRHEVHIRIGSEGNAPIWAVLPVAIHRALPADAKIQWAWIKVRSVGGTRRYFLQLVMESETFSVRSAPGHGVAAVNFGWRAHSDGSRRVAYLVDDRGHGEEFCIPAKIESSLAFVDGLRSARDLHFEEAKRALGAYMALHDVPEWLKEETKHLWQWRSPKKLAKVASRLSQELLVGDTDVPRWRAERLTAPKRDLFAPAAEIFAWLGKSDFRSLAVYLELWRQKNRHLWQWEAQQRLNTLAHRNELFRVWSRRVADRYAEIRIEQFDLREMAKTPEPDEEARPKGFRVTRAAAAPGELRSRLIEAAGPKVVKAPAHGNTVICFQCRHENERSLLHRVKCAGCGEEFDQDANNCRNQLRERPGATETPVGARNPEKPLIKQSVTGKRQADDDASRDVVAAE